MDKNKNAEENLKSLSYFMQEREGRLFDEIKEEAVFYSNREDGARKECSEEIEKLRKATEDERERLNQAKEKAIVLKRIATEKRINSKGLFSGPVPSPECVEVVEKMSFIAGEISTQEAKNALEAICKYTKSAMERKMDQETLDEIVKRADNLIAICEKDSVEKALEYKINQRQAERDQRLKQYGDNVRSTIDIEVTHYIGNLRLELLGEKYAFGEPPRVRSTK